jgi:hypothetical protein
MYSSVAEKTVPNQDLFMINFISSKGTQACTACADTKAIKYCEHFSYSEDACWK